MIPSMRPLITLCVLVGLVSVGAVVGARQATTDREALLALYNEGNYKDAYEGLRLRALEPQSDDKYRVDDLRLASDCLRRLNRVAELDALWEEVANERVGDASVLRALANLYFNANHRGYIVAGEYKRGRHRGGRARRVYTYFRDRTRALQLMEAAHAAAISGEPTDELDDLYWDWATILRQREAWRLQIKTDTAELPDSIDGWYYHRDQGAPVDEEENPVLYSVPESYAAAANDGERWRWCLTQVVDHDETRRDQVRTTFASFLLSQFGVQTMAAYGLPESNPEDESSPFAVHTLKDDETIAKLATGIRRFELPDEFNALRIFADVFRNGNADNYRQGAADQLAGVYENRRQYAKAVKVWREAIEQFGSGGHRADRLQRIVGNWGRFPGTAKTIPGESLEFEYRFRNATSVRFRAYRVEVEKLLGDVKEYLEDGPDKIDWQKVNLGNLGYRFVRKDEDRYRGERVADWTEELKPYRDHYDRTITVTTPVKAAGAYLVEAQVSDGNRSFCVLWAHDTVIAKLPGDQSNFYYVADAVSGTPIERANVEVFGYRQERKSAGQYEVYTKKFAEYSDRNGLMTTTAELQPRGWNWLITARKGDRLAFLGFDSVWYRGRSHHIHSTVRDYAVTDRPVYRPGQTANFHAWYREARYDLGPVTEHAGDSLRLMISDPMGETVYDQTLTADEYAGVGGSWDIPTDAKLGSYRLQIAGSHGINFRVEEYKKPEFEVLVESPTEAVELGETFDLKVVAKYYFGAPVTNAKLEYKVLRSAVDHTFYPYSRWDWLYGSGYWWYSYDYDWYPGWKHWGCRRPHAWWWGSRGAPPEVVAEGEAEVGPDGTYSIRIDTALAKELHGDKSHRYRVEANVTDQSRRTITGGGSVTVAKEPFKVFAWLNRGHYRIGDEIRASFIANTIDNEPIQGSGVLRLFRVTHPGGELKEALVSEWPLDTDDEGRASHTLSASRAGQYRLALEVTDSSGRTREGATVFIVRGDGVDDSNFRFNALELVNDKREYSPGDNVELMINTNRESSTVLLFVRPEGGIYPAPKILRIDGKSTVESIEVLKADMPNFYVEAVTVADGQVHVQTKELVVPPESRVLDVAVKPSKTEFLPGQEASVEVSLKDPNGEPFVGSTVVAIYDKAVEYISGGPNAADIREAFWKWRRRHYPTIQHTIRHWPWNIVEDGSHAMHDVGVFGGLEAVDGEERDADKPAGGKAKRRSRGARSLDLGSADGVVAETASAAPARDAGDGFFGAEKQGDSGEELVEPEVRSNFADTALWVAALETDATGKATVSLDMPENLTTWKVRVWAMGHGTKVGAGDTEILTTKNLVLRMQAPRFFTERDEVVLSANVHNYLATAKQVKVSLEFDGSTLEMLDSADRMVEVAANGETRVDWRVKVSREGEAVVRMLARTDEESDAMEQRFPVHVHGMTRTESFSGVVRPTDDEESITFTIPSERRVPETRLEVRYSPTLAGAMVDALPYLLDYPYGCTEQTLNRFLPAAITQKVLRDIGVDLASIREKRANLNAQEIGDDAERAAQWKRFKANPVFDEQEMAKIVKAGVNRLTEMQVSDGGWGWFSGWGERSYPHTTATVVRGLLVAQENDVAIVPGVIEDGVAWLKRYQVEQLQRLDNAATRTRPWKSSADNLDAYVYLVLAQAGQIDERMEDYLYRDRTNLAVYALALFGVGLDIAADLERRDMVVKNLSQYEVEDDENQTLYLNLPGGHWWYWYGNEYEAQAAYLKLLSRTDPKGRKASRLVKYLLNNRKHATYWRSTRDTALCVEAMADFLRASGEDRPDMTVEVWLDGTKRKEVRITGDNLFGFDNKFVLEGAAVTSGEHTLEIRRRGRGPVYFNAYVSTFTLEDHIAAAGLELKVNRKVYKLIREEDATADVRGQRGQAIRQKVEKYRRVELHDGDELASGDLVEIELKIDSKNDYEYLIFEDFKAAGFEPVDVRSGYNGNDLGAYVEFRDRTVCFFSRRLARGTNSVAYRLRAEIPGRFAALPTTAYAMYAPELRGNSDEIKLEIVDAD